jgi:hypothetical protein
VDSGLACRGHPFEDLGEFLSLLPKYQSVPLSRLAWVFDQ